MAGTNKYNTFKPDLAQLPDQQPVVYVCCLPTADRKSLTGCYRVAVRGRVPLQIVFDVPRLFGKSLMSEYQCAIVLKTEDIIFQNNCWFSEWISFNEEVEAGRIKFIPLSASAQPVNDDDVQARARREFSESNAPGCIRFEVTIGPKEEYIVLRCRFVPQIKSVCKSNSFLRGGDVLSMDVATFKTAGYRVDQMDPVKLARLPFGPILFYDAPTMTDEEYIECVANGFGPIMYHMKALREPKRKEAKEYADNPTADTGNAPRFNWITKPAASHSVPQVLSSQGTYQLANFGSKKDISDFMQETSQKIILYTSLGRKTNTWSSYMTHWRAYAHFCQIQIQPPEVPISVDDLLEYILFLKENRCLEFSSIMNYLSGLKMLHKLNDAPLSSFSSYRVELLLSGLNNVSIVKSIDPNVESFQRNVITWNILRAFGYLLFSSNCYDDYNKQVIWTASLVGFFGCFRMGDILSKTTKRFEPISGFSWGKVHVHEPGHLIITNLLPKCSEDPGGETVDLFTFTADPRCCPVQNLDKLMNMTKLGTKDEDPIFRFNNGDLLTTSKMNAILSQYLTQHFPEGKFYGHSFRSGLASLIAAHPEYFTENDAKLVGRWRSDAVKKYQRTKGVAVKETFERVNTFLSQI